MKAAVWYAREDVRVEEVPEPLPGPGEVVVKVRWCGICGSDLHEFTNGPFFIPVDSPHPLTGRTAPLTLGHEFSGDVVEVGSGVTTVQPGQRVTADACWYCGECYWCKRNRYNICRKGASTGLAADGAFAAYVKVPAYAIYQLPDNVSYEMGALTEPTAVGLHAVHQGKVTAGDSVVVIGAGTIGLTSAAAARAAGAGQVIVIEPIATRRDVVARLGAHPLDPSGDVRRQVIELTEGVGADVVIEAVGSPRTASLALNLARRAGTIVMVGLAHEPAPLDLSRLVFHEKTIVGSLGYAGEFAAALALMADGRIDPSLLITGHIGLHDIVSAGFRELVTNKDRHLKILVSPEE